MPRSCSSPPLQSPSFGDSLPRTSWGRVVVVLTVMCIGVSFVGLPVRAAEVSFQNDVMAVLSKAGCNLGTCHGNARGKGGFQISLRGQDPMSDFAVLTRDWSSRRANVSEPDRSLLLLKPTQQIAHEGGKRFEIDSAEYRLLHEWIAAGMPSDRAEGLKLVKLSVTPSEAFLTLVPSPPSSGERARVRGPNEERAVSKPVAKMEAAKTEEPLTLALSPDQRSVGARRVEGTKPEAKRGTPHPNPLPSKARGEGTKPEEAKRDSADSARGPLALTAWQLQLTVRAEFSDGTTRDVTTRTVYEVAQPIADVSHDGLVMGRSVGETTILVRYLNQQIGVRVAFIPERPGFVKSQIEPANFIDELVFAKLNTLRINPSVVCDDATFVRRVHLDLLGLIPTADEARAFVADRATDKRTKLIEALLERPEFGDWWALKWSDLLRIEEKTLDRKGVENFHGWLRDSFATNKPLDQMIREIVAARGSTYEVPPANFYRALRTPFERSEAVGQLFLGVRLQCAKCHNHPFDRWTQDDYYSWGSVFANIDYKIIENRRRDDNDKHEFDGEQIVFHSTDDKPRNQAKDPRTEKVRAAKFLGEQDRVDRQTDPLEELARWLTDPGNDRFVQMLANRTWQQVMGRGIVDPVDDFRATNPAVNPALLKALADELRRGSQFAPRAERVVGRTSNNSRVLTEQVGRLASALPVAERQGYLEEIQAFDLRRLLRVILNSKTYQLSSEPNDTNREDEVNFSRSVVRRLSAEQLLDATSQVCDVPLDFTGYPSGPRATQLPGVGVMRRREAGPSDADRFLKAFGKPPRLQSCDCERSEETTLGQTFQLVSGSLVNRMLATNGNRLNGWLNSNRPSREIITELFWTMLTRAPTDEELRETILFLEKSPQRRAALEDITWGLLNSHEFLLRL